MEARSGQVTSGYRDRNWRRPQSEAASVEVRSGQVTSGSRVRTLAPATVRGSICGGEVRSGQVTSGQYQTLVMTGEAMEGKTVVGKVWVG